MVADDDFAPEDLDFEPEEEDLDFDEEEAFEAPPGSRVPTKSGANIYTMLLVLSAIFYTVGLVATLYEMKPYCEKWLWELF
jgi:hypothetical protein